MSRIPACRRRPWILSTLALCLSAQTLAQDLGGDKYRTWTDRLVWRTFSAAVAAHDAFTLYDGSVAETHQTAPQIEEVRVERAPALRPVEIIVPAIQNLQRVLLAGRTLNKIEGGSSNTGWRFDSRSRNLHLWFEADNFRLTIEK